MRVRTALAALAAASLGPARATAQQATNVLQPPRVSMRFDTLFRGTRQTMLSADQGAVSADDRYWHAVAGAPLYERVRGVIPSIEWPAFAEDIEVILRLKRERDAVILAHNYQTPEIFHCVADIVGDSLALAREAMKTDAAVIVLAMAVAVALLLVIQAKSVPPLKDLLPMVSIFPQMAEKLETVTLPVDSLPSVKVAAANVTEE